jgi:hypothetical protein
LFLSLPKSEDSYPGFFHRGLITSMKRLHHPCGPFPEASQPCRDYGVFHISTSPITNTININYSK